MYVYVRAYARTSNFKVAHYSRLHLSLSEYNGTPLGRKVQSFVAAILNLIANGIEDAHKLDQTYNHLGCLCMLAFCHAAVCRN